MMLLTSCRAPDFQAEKLSSRIKSVKHVVVLPLDGAIERTFDVDTAHKDAAVPREHFSDIMNTYVLGHCNSRPKTGARMTIIVHKGAGNSHKWLAPWDCPRVSGILPDHITVGSIYDWGLCGAEGSLPVS